MSRALNRILNSALLHARPFGCLGKSCVPRATRAPINSASWSARELSKLDTNTRAHTQSTHVHFPPICRTPVCTKRQQRTISRHHFPTPPPSCGAISIDGVCCVLAHDLPTKLHQQTNHIYPVQNTPTHPDTSHSHSLTHSLTPNHTPNNNNNTTTRQHSSLMRVKHRMVIGVSGGGGG